MMDNYTDSNTKIPNQNNLLKNSEINDIISDDNINDEYENSKNIYENASAENYYKKESNSETFDLDNKKILKNKNNSEEFNDIYKVNCDDNLNKHLLNSDNKKKKKKYDNFLKNKNEKKYGEFKEIPYCSFNNFEEKENDKKIKELNDNGYNLFNKEKLKKIEKKKKKYTEKNKKKKGSLDDKKFSEVYNSIYENLKQKKEIKQNIENNYSNKSEFYEINYTSSDNVNSISSVEDDSLFNEDILKKYIIGQVLNIIRTSFHWVITSFFLIFLFFHFSIFYVYRLISFLTLFLFTPISIYLVKKKSIKFFLILTNIVRLLIWGIFIPILYYYYKDQIKKYYINRIYELIFVLLLVIDNIQINVSNLIDIDNNGIDFLSKKYDLKINEKAKRKFLTLHQFFFDASFIIMNPLLIFVMYIFSNFFDEMYYRDVFIYSSAFIFSFITIITIFVYSNGLKKKKIFTCRNNDENSHNIGSENTRENIDNLNANKRYNNEDDFEKYYEKQKYTNKKYNVHNNNYSNICNNQVKKYLKEKTNIEYDDYINEEISLKDQFKKQFTELINNFSRIKREKKMIFYIAMLSYLNSVEDIMVLMLIPLTSIYVSEFFYINNLFIKILIAVILISLTKCFENISYYSNKKSIIALKDIFIGIILSGISLLFYFFPFLLLNHLNIYSFLIFYIICCLFYFFFSTNLKTKLSLNLQRNVKEIKSDIYNCVGLFMSFINLLFVFLTSFFLSLLDNFVLNYVFICTFLILLLVLFYIWGFFILKRESN
ncbi:conserved Plasmodium protein, unknown function [Plasmodium relictum]|uniref:Transporter n=1 Tax=Plasmodium relictum TaxID=85471 RepID=A0A1J1H540_PLARL|nr:conserved Plasmodium protein, unknown function [Plasmodium relictum]CRG99874.1 conserved Plasmodium protein, unknown function [Plasmodium relictum]